MNKYVLLENEVINCIVEQIVGIKGDQQYYSRKIECIKKPNILYVSNNVNVFPPILIEVQHVADDSFLHRVVSNCQEIHKEYGTVPIVLIFVVNKIRDNIMRKATMDSRFSYILKIPCFPWAKKCMLLNDNSIHDYLNNTPLPPLVALSAFFNAQTTSVCDHNQSRDPTIQMLCNVSKRISKGAVINENTVVNDLLSLYDISESKFKESIKILEELPENNGNKRAIDCLNDGLIAIKSYKIKYTSSELSPVSSPASSPVPSSIPLSPAISLTESTPLATSMSSRNWKFVDKYIQSLGDDKMNWKACFLEGQRQGLFSNYTKPISLKSAYQRWKKQQN